MIEPVFLTIDQVLIIQKVEAALTNSPTEIRNKEGLESAIAAPQASFDGECLMDLFEMAATYISSISMNHPFIDGNKRTAAGSAIAFLSLNGYQLNEEYDEELADMTLNFINKTIDKNQLAKYFKDNIEEIP